MPKPPSNSNWDPLLLISQIVSMQTLHYLTLSLLVPPLLDIFADPAALEYHGGASNVGMIMDWRQMAGVPPSGSDTGKVDSRRGWLIAFCWILASFLDTAYLTLLIRRPRLILDFALTLLFNHLVLTTYYAARVPSSGFWWGVVGVGTLGMVVAAEQMCVRREMREGLEVGGGVRGEGGEGEEGEDGVLLEEMELGERRD
ncbi:integral membrane protein S linking to the trans Golgi network-domain-containing protein [Armillaria luteobubalina]|uniref:Integral membrane protein S linking to the trans Golgi network-domain-containing protein n=1 Tax=Armillaria luteobubalina TaxID=153913 RepID=A0AA39QF98_9AGAR|nr:integral membrane protein S linking to the trans Golgi network-domain-containing protein [Armillaria luteobubalina]